MHLMGARQGQLPCPVVFPGGISFWDAAARGLEEDSKTHRCTVTALSWSPCGERLASGDERGKVSGCLQAVVLVMGCCTATASVDA